MVITRYHNNFLSDGNFIPRFCRPSFLPFRIVSRLYFQAYSLLLSHPLDLAYYLTVSTIIPCVTNRRRTRRAFQLCENISSSNTFKRSSENGVFVEIQ
jgi:hypothetical protein